MSDFDKAWAGILMLVAANNPAIAAETALFRVGISNIKLHTEANSQSMQHHQKWFLALHSLVVLTHIHSNL